jgi:RND family efflux transporter MFP subunit
VIASVDVVVGQRVQRGQRLFRLDDERIRSDIVIARAALRSAEANAVRARAALDMANGVLRRRREAADLYSAEELEKTEGTARMAAADLEADSASLDVSRARLAQLQSDLQHASVVAPFAGVVAARYLESGSTVEPTTSVVRLVAEGPEIVRFAVPPDEAANYQPGSAVEVVFRGGRGSVRATVRSVAPHVDPAIDMILVEAVLPSGGSALDVKPGMVGKVRPVR